MRRLDYDERTGDFNEVEIKIWPIILKAIFVVALLTLIGGGIYLWKSGWQVSDFLELTKCWMRCVRSECGDVLQSLDTWGMFVWCGVAFGLMLIFLFRKVLIAVFLVIGKLLFYPVIKWWKGVSVAWGNKDWMMLFLYTLFGFVLYWAYIFAIPVGIMLFQNFRFEGIADLLLLGILIGCVILYFKALGMAKSGELVVFRDWGDFFKSSVWIYVIPVGLVFVADTTADGFHHLLGWLFLIAGICSFVYLVRGAFKNNTGGLGWLSLFSRLSVVFLSIAAVSELYSRLERYKKGELGIVRGVLLPLLVFALVFNTLVRPMIGTVNRRSW